jgi:hypothetical protein
MGRIIHFCACGSDFFTHRVFASYILSTEKKGVGTNFGRRRRGRYLPVGRQRRAFEGARIVHRGWHPGPREAILPHRRRRRRDTLLLLGEGELGHVGAQRSGGTMTADGRWERGKGWGGNCWNCWNEKRVVMEFDM